MDVILKTLLYKLLNIGRFADKAVIFNQYSEIRNNVIKYEFWKKYE